MKQPLPQQRYSNLSKLGNITVPYGGSTRYEQFHPGIDIANVKGTPINAPASGVVTPINAPASGVVTDAVGGKVQGDKDYGNTLIIKDKKGNKHRLSHLEQLNVRPGQQVVAGQTPVGTMGNSGSAYSPSGRGDGTHLDYRLVTAYGKYKNPMTYLKNL
jgi:murein DD-endopeptidase MepM/ murein hydrolase activator NlpD